MVGNIFFAIAIILVFIEIFMRSTKNKCSLGIDAFADDIKLIVEPEYEFSLSYALNDYRFAILELFPKNRQFTPRYPQHHIHFKGLFIANFEKVETDKITFYVVMDNSAIPYFEEYLENFLLELKNEYSA